MGSQLVTRRNVISAAAAVSAGAALDSLFLEPNWLEVARHDVAVSGLPRHLDGFAIAQVTDAHLTTLGTVEATIARVVREQDVQLVALTGDIIDDRRRMPILKEFCAALRGAGRNLVATLGNWEHWAGIPLDDLRTSYSSAGAELLVNESRVLPDGVRLCATDDDTGGSVQLQRAMGAGSADARVLLTHSPGFLDAIPPQAGRFALTLAGHTHGGQMRLGAGLVPFVPPGSGRFVSGWYEVPVGRAYVSRGTGTSIAPMRFTCRPELPIYRLRQA